MRACMGCTFEHAAVHVTWSEEAISAIAGCDWSAAIASSTCARMQRTRHARERMHTRVHVHGLRRFGGEAHRVARGLDARLVLHVRRRPPLVATQPRAVERHLQGMIGRG